MISTIWRSNSHKGSGHQCCPCGGRSWRGPCWPPPPPLWPPPLPPPCPLAPFSSLSSASAENLFLNTKLRHSNEIKDQDFSILLIHGGLFRWYWSSLSPKAILDSWNLWLDWRGVDFERADDIAIHSLITSQSRSHWREIVHIWMFCLHYIILHQNWFLPLFFPFHVWWFSGWHDSHPPSPGPMVHRLPTLVNLAPHCFVAHIYHTVMWPVWSSIFNSCKSEDAQEKTNLVLVKPKCMFCAPDLFLTAIL